jgi:hypothetical protein
MVIILSDPSSRKQSLRNIIISCIDDSQKGNITVNDVSTNSTLNDVLGPNFYDQIVISI